MALTLNPSFPRSDIARFSYDASGKSALHGTVRQLREPTPGVGGVGEIRTFLVGYAGAPYRVTQIRKEHSTHYLVELIGMYGHRSKIAKGDPRRFDIIHNLKHAIKYGRVHI
ncbi:hypothetical protein [Corynebacterium glutamicum]|uniref:hypothetical protein n=1 Tax=Corynebacterium glutamicum TaxID=1718 RepID=UPI0005C6E1C7|nr:hypothetical protein [Corynebacterium glutamicum]